MLRKLSFPIFELFILIIIILLGIGMRAFIADYAWYALKAMENRFQNINPATMTPEERKQAIRQIKEDTATFFDVDSENDFPPQVTE